MNRYKVELGYTHDDWNGKEVVCTEDSIAYNADEAERDCVECIERDGYKVTRVIATWVDNGKYFSCV